MIVEIKMIFIGTTKITPKNRSELVFFGCMDCKRLVLGGPVQSPQYLGRSWTVAVHGCAFWVKKTRLNWTLKHYMQHLVLHHHTLMTMDDDADEHNNYGTGKQTTNGKSHHLFLDGGLPTPVFLSGTMSSFIR
jgi:hypothetical protein